jgi:hypothetical protein
MGNNVLNSIKAPTGQSDNLSLVTHNLAMIHKYPDSEERCKQGVEQVKIALAA